MPGGKIAVYSGILDVTKNTNGLAAVMGHEIAHAVAKHSVERMSQAMAINLGTQVADIFLKGAGGLLTVAVILLFALALGDVANALGTGIYVASLVEDTIPAILLLPLLFLISGVIAFSIGSSWGTFAIMIPLAIQISLALDFNSALFLAAVLSGSVFGDHASPISDTTVVASMASATDHIDHVRTQLPYALIAAGIATIGFLLVGMFAL